MNLSLMQALRKVQETACVYVRVYVCVYIYMNIHKAWHAGTNAGIVKGGVNHVSCILPMSVSEPLGSPEADAHLRLFDLSRAASKPSTHFGAVGSLIEAMVETPHLKPNH